MKMVPTDEFYVYKSRISGIPGRKVRTSPFLTPESTPLIITDRFAPHRINLRASDGVIFSGKELCGGAARIPGRSTAVRCAGAANLRVLGYGDKTLPAITDGRLLFEGGRQVSRTVEPYNQEVFLRFDDRDILTRAGRTGEHKSKEGKR